MGDRRAGQFIVPRTTRSKQQGRALSNGQLFSFQFFLVHGNWNSGLDPKTFTTFTVSSPHLLLQSIRFTWLQLGKAHAHHQVQFEIQQMFVIESWNRSAKGLWVSAAEIHLWVKCVTGYRSYLSQFAVNRHVYITLPLWVGPGLKCSWSIFRSSQVSWHLDRLYVQSVWRWRV